jgi:mono/diheme cytochrome c family protein
MQRVRAFTILALALAFFTIVTSILVPLSDEAARSQTVQARILPDWVDLTDEALVERGKYLVHDVAMCVQCHSPHHDDGALDQRQLLAGAPVPIQSPFSKQTWAFRAPALAGLPGGWSEPQLVHLLRTGETPSRHPLRPPMPPFRLTEDDARSVAAYLKSLR